MFKIVVVIAIVIIVPVLGLLIYAATKPDSFSIERSASIEAPPEEIFAILSDFRRSADWSPFEELDPAMKRSYGGAPSGQGALYAWEGNDKAGAGSMEITEASPPSRLTMKLDFIRPFEAHNVVVFTLEPEADATRVTWTMHGPMPYMAKLMSTFASMDRMVGKDFEVGLANLKRLAEQ